MAERARSRRRRRARRRRAIALVVGLAVVAATVPAESALPCAVTHLPTFTDFDVVAASVVIFVFPSTVTVLFVVDVLLEPNCRAAITSVEPDTDVTLPAATAEIGRPCTPEGSPDGSLPDGKPEGGAPVKRPPPGPPDPPGPVAPPVHEPFTAGLIVTVVAVNDVADESVPEGATAATQSPAFTSAIVTAT